jgi:hypothetical protein
VFKPFASLIIVVLAVAAAAAQKAAVLTPDGAPRSIDAAAAVEKALDEKISVQDGFLAAAAFKTAAPATPFNLTKEQSKNLGASIGCDVFILVRASTLRRSSSARPEYYEASAAIFSVSTRTGRLIDWQLLRFEASRPQTAEKLLKAALAPFARALAARLTNIIAAEIAEPPPAEMEEPPDNDSPTAKNFRAPIPFRRIKPAYTSDAYLYDVAGTVDMTIDLDASGTILRTEVVRWAGYGLDESVERTVRSMNWRAAERNGKPLAMRFLVRYNFRKIEHE